MRIHGLGFRDYTGVMLGMKGYRVEGVCKCHMGLYRV